MCGHLECLSGGFYPLSRQKQLQREKSGKSGDQNEINVEHGCEV
jgi:hypothetical protein